MAEPVTAAAEPCPRVDEPTRATEQRLNLSISTTSETVIVRVSGTVDRQAAGRLYDTLVDVVGDGGMNLIVDLSRVRLMTRAGVRGLIVAAKLMRHARDDMRICGARKSVAAFLRDLGFNHLLALDPALKASMAVLSGETLCAATSAPAATVKRRRTAS